MSSVMTRENDSDHPDVMISSTYMDLREHRKAAVDALLRLGLFPIGMEFDSAKAGKDVIDSSLAKVKKARAYVGIVSHRYGGVPKDPKRNPEELSITELEYRAALTRGIPVYMFVMNGKHPVMLEDVERVEAYRTRLEKLKEDVRQRSVYAEFSSVESLKGLILQSMAELKIQEERRLRAKQSPRGSRRKTKTEPKLPCPPTLLAVPDFTSGHKFIGRRTELAWLDEWAASDDPLMVIEAIGGTGKSTLTWHWFKERAPAAISGLAGSLWYSFYEGGADMAAFAAFALAYTTGRPIKEFRARKTSDLARSLIAALHERPFLLVLDGFERVLVAYHRLDASQARDDEVPVGSDDRACIKPADAELIRQLVAAVPSKILVTSRLLPTALTNTAGRPFPGVRHHILGGMHPDDAIAMMRGLGIRGDTPAISRYLKENFDNHPLVVGIIGGLVADYVRDPGNFDRWVADPQGGAALHLPQLDLKQRRTHILAAALNGLEPGVRRLLSFIATLGYPVPFETIAALNPFASDPTKDSETSREEDGGPPTDALSKLVSALQELERRGLLQWDRQTNRYDLHPVVRGYAFDVLEKRERTDISNRIVDHFESKPPDQYTDLKTVADAQQSITIMRALIHAGRLGDAAEFFSGGLAFALGDSLEEYHEVLALLKPMFPNGFQASPEVTARYQGYLLTSAGIALYALGRFSEARGPVAEALRLGIAKSDAVETRRNLSNFARNDFNDKYRGRSFTAFQLARSIAEAIQDQESLTMLHEALMSFYVETGLFDQAESEYVAFRQLPMPTSQAYRLGDIEVDLCRLRLYQGSLTRELMDQAMAVAHAGNNRYSLRNLYIIRGELALQNGDPSSAITEFERAIEMAQTVGIPAGVVEARLALAKACAGDPQQAIEICERLRDLPDVPDVDLAETYAQLGVTDRAREHALAGYSWAWADGPQYSRWWELRRCRAVLEALGEPEPSLRAFDPKTAEPVPYETQIHALIAKLRENRPES